MRECARGTKPCAGSTRDCEITTGATRFTATCGTCHPFPPTSGYIPAKSRWKFWSGWCGSAAGQGAQCWTALWEAAPLGWRPCAWAGTLSASSRTLPCFRWPRSGFRRKVYSRAPSGIEASHRITKGQGCRRAEKIFSSCPVCPECPVCPVYNEHEVTDKPPIQFFSLLKAPRKGGRLMPDAVAPSQLPGV